MAGSGLNVHMSASAVKASALNFMSINHFSPGLIPKQYVGDRVMSVLTTMMGLWCVLSDGLAGGADVFQAPFLYPLWINKYFHVDTVPIVKLKLYFSST